MDDWAGFWVGMVVMGILAWLAIKITQYALDDSWRQQITDHGCGGFYLDANNNRQWNWKEGK